MSVRIDGAPQIGAIVGLAAVIVVAGRIVVAGGGNVASFILVGRHFATPGRLPRGVPVFPGFGYDGQFYYRLALDPLNLRPRAYGIHVDSVARFGRISYPALAWLVSGGRTWLVPWSLVSVNVAGLVMLGVLGAVLAGDVGRHAAWGLLLPAYFGFLWSLSRDLTEIVAGGFMVLGLLAVRRGRSVLAGVALSVGLLARETVVLVVVLLAAEPAISAFRHRICRARSSTKASTGTGASTALPLPGRGGTRSIAWILPMGVFVAWQLVVRSKAGSLAVASSGHHNLAVPFAGITDGLRHYLSRLPSSGSLLWTAELLVLVVVVVTAAVSLRTTTAPYYERVVWMGYAIMPLVLARGIWLGDVGFRSLDDLYVMSWVILLSSRVRLGLATLGIGVSWLAVAVELVRFI